MAQRWNWILVAALVGCGGSGPRQVEEPKPEPVVAEPEEDDDEEEPDDIEVEGLLGTLDVADIQPVIDRHARKLVACHRDHIGALRYVGGKVELKFRVARDGTVRRVQVASGDLGAWPVEKCVLGVARQMTFPPPRGGEAEFSFPIDFPAQGRVVRLDELSATAELGARLGDLDACAAEAGVPPPREVQVTVYVAVGGAVTSAGFATTSDEPFDDAWGDCAVGRLMALRLSDPRGQVWKASSWYGAFGAR